MWRRKRKRKWTLLFSRCVSLFTFILLIAGCGEEAGWTPRKWYPYDDVLRLNHIQVKGTHNSYHIAPQEFITVELDYTHAPLQVQFEERGVRQIELDVHFETESHRFRVFHIPVIDEGTTCYFLTDCLREVKEWSDAHPWHLPIFIFIEPKDDIDIVRITPFEPIEGHYEDLEREILSVWPEERIITPDEIKGDYPTLREAVMENGWPTLEDVRGRVIFILLDSGKHRYNYTYGGKSLDGRLMFVTANPEDPFAAIIKIDDPIPDEALIKELVEQGFIVRTRADAIYEALEKDLLRQEVALRSGAHLISTDYPVPGMIEGYYLNLPDSIIARCNPVTAPPECESQYLETPEGP